MFYSEREFKLKNSIKIIAIVLAVVSAAICSRPLMALLQNVVISHGQQLIVFSPTETVSSTILFTLALCACAALVAAVGCWFRRFSLVIRCSMVVLPMLLEGSIMTAHVAAQFEQAASSAGTIGLTPAFQLNQARLHHIPLAAFAAGLIATGVVFLAQYLSTKQKRLEGTIQH
jgi:hypothetical protein